MAEGKVLTGAGLRGQVAGKTTSYKKIFLAVMHMMCLWYARRIAYYRNFSDSRLFCTCGLNIF